MTKDNSVSTKNYLGVFWMFADKTSSVYSEEVDGFSVHSLWKAKPSQGTINLLESEISKLESERIFEFKSDLIDSDEYIDVIGDFKILHWPTDVHWFDLIEQILRQYVEAGAEIAFINTEYGFAWPQLFEVEESGSIDAVYAAFAPSVGFICHSAPDEPMRYLTLEEVKDLRTVLIKSQLV